MTKPDMIDIIGRNSKAVPSLEDYRDPDTGLLICSRCGTPKECVVPCPNGQKKIMGRMCDCAAKKWDIAQARKKEDLIEELRIECIPEADLRAARFSRSQDSEAIQAAEKYVANWENAKDKALGLVLWGPPGTGKTHVAACIANAFIDKGIPVAIDTMVSLLSLPFDEQQAKVRQYIEVPLLVIDDLGAEQSTDYKMGVVYNIIDKRVKAGKPMVITTNLGIANMNEPQSDMQRRIYRRVLDKCQPFAMTKKSYQPDVRAKREKLMAPVFGKEQ